ncbi:MAG: ATP-binding protein [Actinomycetota bacterium]
MIEVIDRRILEWGDGVLAERLGASLYELALNIEEHAERPGFAMMQWYPKANRLDLSVADRGRGIRSSLASGGHEFPDNRAAVFAATTERVSRKAGGGGFGLPYVLNTVTQLRGAVRVHSGDAAVEASAAPRVLPSPSWQGTVVDVSFTWRFA